MLVVVTDRVVCTHDKTLSTYGPISTQDLECFANSPCAAVSTDLGLADNNDQSRQLATSSLASLMPLAPIHCRDH